MIRGANEGGVGAKVFGFSEPCLISLENRGMQSFAEDF